MRTFGHSQRPARQGHGKRHMSIQWSMGSHLYIANRSPCMQRCKQDCHLAKLSMRHWLCRHDFASGRYSAPNEDNLLLGVSSRRITRIDAAALCPECCDQFLHGARVVSPAQTLATNRPATIMKVIHSNLLQKSRLDVGSSRRPSGNRHERLLHKLLRLYASGAEFLQRICEPVKISTSGTTSNVAHKAHCEGWANEIDHCIEMSLRDLRATWCQRDEGCLHGVSVICRRSKMQSLPRKKRPHA